MEESMNDIYKWLSNYFQYDKPFDEVLKDEKATSFLLIWPIFEQNIFNGFAKVNDIPNVADKLESNYTKYDIEEMAKYFYNRYKDSKKRKQLMHNQKADFFISLLEKEYNALSNKEKLTLTIYVVFRYRNNIFHGNKGVTSWTKYSIEIKLCITIMMNLLDGVLEDEK